MLVATLFALERGATPVSTPYIQVHALLGIAPCHIVDSNLWLFRIEQLRLHTQLG
jgi:hypothetical protein